MDKPTLGLYLHIPFCLNKCIYCDFYSLPRTRWQRERYVAALCRKLREMGEVCRDYRVDTVYVGGGTPTCLGPEPLADILETVRDSFDLDLAGEITFEANPESADDVSALRTLRQAGFNRVSLGVQSADDRILKTLGRPHTFQKAGEAVAAIRAAGFENLSLDLIYGLPGQDMAIWQDTLQRVCGLSPEHLSCYGLQVEEGTPLWRMQDRLSIPDDDRQADFYLYTVEYLAGRGFAQYEISNFAKPGYHSRHNMKYWILDPYLGLGPGASSDFGGERFTCSRDLEAWCSRVEAGEDPFGPRQPISPRERQREYLMLGLRTVHGVCREEYLALGPDRSADRWEKVLAKYTKYGYTVENQGRWRLTPTGFLVSNQILAEAIE